MQKQTSKNPKATPSQKAATNSGQRTAGLASSAAGFISGPAQIHIGGSRIDMTEIVSERFEPKRCVDVRGGRLICVAYDHVENREVALKVERKPAHIRNGHVTSLEREALIGRYLPDHANVMALHQLYYLPGVDGRRLVLLAMQYADGGSFRSWLQQQVPWDLKAQAASLHHFRSLCLGVGALHERGIKHLDLKPENLLLCSGVAKVSDFGAACISRPARNVGKRAPIPPPEGSHSTPNYMSPEQFTARSLDELTVAADIYALGVILFEILNPLHRPPFIGSYQQLCRLHQAAPVPECPGLPPGEVEIVRCCMAKDPRDRFESVEHLLEALDTVFPIGFEADPAFLSEGEADDDLPEGNGPNEDRSQAGKEAATGLYEEVMRNLDQGDLDELLELAAKAAELCPDHPQGQVVNTRLAHRVKAFTENTAACQSDWEAGRFDSALSFAQQAAAVNPKSVLAARLVAQVSRHLDKIRGLRSGMANAANAGNFERALQLATQLDDLGVPADPDALQEGGGL